ncbi:Zinc finger, CCHC-type [Sesbania bispinosa]|nr:Zinc finger, CCHC-type [Sesbania bispinosa]
MGVTVDLNPFSDDKNEIIEDCLPNTEEEGDTSVYSSYIEAAEKSISTKTIFAEKNFTVLDESNIKRLQEADINQVSYVLCISKFSACLLLRHCEWSVTKVLETWIDNEERVRNAVGFLKQPQIRSAGCGHPFCMICWMRYMDTKIDEGPYKCLTLRCPEPSCGAAVDGNMVHELTSESSKKSFCWRCGEEAHRPVDCETAHQWIRKNTSESEIVDWLVAHTKPCPQCKIPIERSAGSTHMMCNCGFQFCWLCLGDWFTFRPCKCHNNQFQETSKKELESEMSRGYFDRPETDFNFIIEAWKQVIECRGILKWCYTYGYYLPDNIKVKKDFFEYIHHKAEVTFEKLDQCVGMELREYLNVERKDDFNDFCLKLVNLTNVTKNYFDKLVKALEDGLVDVHVNNDTSMKRKSSEIGKTSYRRGTKRIITIDGLAKNDLWQCEACGHYNSASSLVCQNTNCRQYFD